MSYEEGKRSHQHKGARILKGLTTGNSKFGEEWIQFNSSTDSQWSNLIYSQCTQMHMHFFWSCFTTIRFHRRALTPQEFIQPFFQIFLINLMLLVAIAEILKKLWYRTMVLIQTFLVLYFLLMISLLLLTTMKFVPYAQG